MFRKLIIASIIILTFYVNVNSQCTQEWVQRYHYGIDMAYSITVDGAGNVYVTGSSNNDYATIKYNSSGVQQWIQRYNSGSDRASSIAVDAAGNVYVTGRSDISGLYYDYATIKYNSSGVQQWVQRYSGPGNSADQATSIAVDSAGNVYVTGGSPGSGTSYDYATIKYNSSGDSLWVKRYNGPGNGSDNAYSIAVDGAGNVYVTGSSFGSGTLYDYATIKYNSSGVQQWVQRYNGPGNLADEASSIKVDSSGNIYVTGGSPGSGTGSDYATIKYNSSGDSLWVQRYNGPGNGSDKANSIAVDGTENIYVTGSSSRSGSLNDYATIKYNSSGVQQWVQRYGGVSDNVANSIAVDGAGNAYVTGYCYASAFTHDYATIKYNSSGDSLWVKRYNGPTSDDDRAYSIAVDGTGNVYVTGYSENNNNEDYATIKYTQSVTSVKEENDIPSVFKLYQNYPNPFNPSTTIKFDIPKAQFVKITVFDILGREISKLVNEFKQAGNYEINFDASALSSGTYFYKLQAGDFSDVKRLVLIK